LGTKSPADLGIHDLFDSCPFAFIRGSASFFKESAGLFADQNMKRDAPWTAWSKMLQLLGRNGLFDPRSFFLFAFIRIYSRLKTLSTQYLFFFATLVSWR
jgi:hypothetical protein